MKIWVIGRGYPTPANKMWGSFELEQAKLLARGGHDVSYIALTLSFFDRKDPRGLRAFEEDGVAIYAYSHFYFPGKAGIYLEGFEDRCWRQLFQCAEKRSGKPELIHVHYPSMISSIHEIEKYRKQGVKLFATEHWSRVLVNNLKKHELARLRYYASHSNCFAFVSEALLKAARKRVEVTVPTEIVPNIVSPFFFRTAGKKKTDGSFTYISVGRLVELKQFDAVIQAFLSEFSGEEGVRFRIVGSGPERKKLEELAHGSGQITFTGELSLMEAAQEIADADVLVSFSRYETFAAPVSEAWASGKPAIVSNRSGVAAFVNDRNGRKVPANDRGALQKALREIRENYGSYDPDEIRAYAEEHFHDDAVLNQLNHIYSSY